MLRTHRRILTVPLFAFLGTVSLFTSADTGIQRTDLSGKSHLTGDKPAAQDFLRKLPLTFIKNAGQKEKSVLFYEQGIDHTTVFTNQGISHSLGSESGETVTLVPLKASPFAIEALDMKEGKVNYFRGQDPKGWKTSIPTYGAILYKGIYPGIDLKVYGTNSQLEYDLTIAPGADPHQIRLSYKGARNLSVTKDGDMAIALKEGYILQKKPVLYQTIHQSRKAVEGRFLLVDATTYRFEVGPYNHKYPLVIDPVLDYSMYLNLRFADSVASIAVDTSGNTYVAGKTYKTAVLRESDAFILKLNPTAEALIYSTYLAGSADDGVSALAVDSAGNAYVTGDTISTDFPSTPGSFQSTFAGDYVSTGNDDAFVAKLNAMGDSLIYATYLGGRYWDSAKAIAIDSLGSAYVTGRTDSFNFPTSNPYQLNQGSTDVFLAKFNPSGSTLIYSTYLGGGGDDAAFALAVDSSGNAYLAGETFSADFPLCNPYQGAFAGKWDAFVTKFNSSGNALVYSTYLGGTDGSEVARALAVDSQGNAYVAGNTNSKDFPITPGSFQRTLAGSLGADAFVTKLNPAGNFLVYSTYLGGSDWDGTMTVAIDPAGNAYVAGYTGSTDFPVKNPYQGTYAGGYYDAFITKLNPAGNALVYSTYLGGSDIDEITTLAIDRSGSVYVAGGTSSSNFPTRNPFQGNYPNPFITKLVAGRTSIALSLPPGGSADIIDGRSADTIVDYSFDTGYADIKVDSGVTPYGTAVFRYKQDGVTVSEAGVPASSPTTSARIYIDYRKKISAVPGRSEAGKISVNTGIAVVNRGSATAHVSYTLRNAVGYTVSIGHDTIAAGSHFACFLDQLQDRASGFRLPSDFQIDMQPATLEISGDQPLSVTALRGTYNQRENFLMTTTPVADLTQPLSAEAIYFPQFADGGGYTTSLLLMNTSAATETGVLQLFDDNGNPFSVNPVGGAPNSSFPYSIPPGGIFRLQSDGSPKTTAAGWVKLTPQTGTYTPVGSGVFAYNPAAVLVSETGIPSAIATTHARLYVDLSHGHNTGLTIANIADTNAGIVIRAFEKEGATAAGTVKGPLLLSANGHDARFVDEFITGLPAGFTGVLDISSPTPFAALTLRSLINERNEFLMTAFPIADQNRSAPSPIVFPHIAARGGYTTQFILISAGAAAGTTLRFYDETGTPWDFID